MKTRKLKIAYAFLLFMPAVTLLQTSCSDNESDDAAGQGSVEIAANWDDYSEEAGTPRPIIPLPLWVSVNRQWIPVPPLSALCWMRGRMNWLPTTPLRI